MVLGQDRFLGCQTEPRPRAVPAVGNSDAAPSGAHIGWRLPSVSSSGAMFALLALAFGLSQFTDAAYRVAAMRVAGTRTAAATGLMNSGAAGAASLAFPLMGRHLGWDRAIDFSAILTLMSAICWRWIAADRAMVEPNAVTALGVPAAVAATE